VPKTTLAAVAFFEDLDPLPFGACMPCKDSLSDALTDTHCMRCLTEVDEQNLELTAVVGVNGAWCVEQGDSMLQGEPRAGA
jgi:hypothetical protein